MWFQSNYRVAHAGREGLVSLPEPRQTTDWAVASPHLGAHLRGDLIVPMLCRTVPRRSITCRGIHWKGAHGDFPVLRAGVPVGFRRWLPPSPPSNVCLSTVSGAGQSRSVVTSPSGPGSSDSSDELRVNLILYLLRQFRTLLYFIE
jgi:hypothetical protein